MVSYQIAFDLEDNASQEFLLKVIAALPSGGGAAASSPTSKPDSSSSAAASASADAMDTSDDEKKPLMDSDSVVLVDTPEQDAFNKIAQILSGELTIKLNLQFLHRNNNTDLLILKNTKVCLKAYYFNGKAFS